MTKIEYELLEIGDILYWSDDSDTYEVTKIYYDDFYLDFVALNNPYKGHLFERYNSSYWQVNYKLIKDTNLARKMYPKHVLKGGYLKVEL